MTVKHLDKLIEAVERGDKPDFDWTDCIMALGKKARTSQLCVNAYHGSLDAAKALHEALLPGWGFSAGFDEVRHFSDVFKKGNPVITVFASCPARAWLIAILKAYREDIK